MRYSKRIIYLASLVSENDKIIDIGADHGYLSIYLLENNLAKIADASELHEKNTKQIIKNIKKFKLTDKINLHLGSGLQNIEINNYNKFIIAGMGGRKIASIINEKPITQDLILHPTNSYEFLRSTLSKLNYKIIDETIIFEHNINNLIIYAQKKMNNVSLSDADKFLGPRLKLKKEQEIIKNYYNKLYLTYWINYNKRKNDDLREKLKFLESVIL